MHLLKFLTLIIIQIFAINYVNSQYSYKSEVVNKAFIRKQGYSIEACYRMAEDYLRSNSDQRKAIPYLEYIIEEDKNADPKVLLMLSQSYYFNGMFDLAISVITEYLEKVKSGKLKKEAKEELEKYENARRIAMSPLNVAMINLGPKINSKFAEINPFVSKYENLLVFSSKRGRDYDIYVSKKDKYAPFWASSKLAGSYVNTINDEFVAGLTPSGRDLFVHYNQVSGFEDVNVSHRYKGLYRELQDPGAKINSTYREEGACLSKTKDSMFFASDRPEGHGGFDIYYSLRLPNGDWGPPINMGKNINTKFDENYPNLSPDGKRLYFASKGHNSIGGFDVFYTSFDSINNEWKVPVNVGYPINNAYDNKSIAFTDNNRYAYISTIDGKTHGDFDIYKVIFLDVEPEYLIVKAKVYIKDGEETIPYISNDEELTLFAFNEEETYGMYTFDQQKNYFVMALIPGVYILELRSDEFKTYRRRVTIKENYYRNKRRILKIYLEPK